MRRWGWLSRAVLLALLVSLPGTASGDMAPGTVNIQSPCKTFKVSTGLAAGTTALISGVAGQLIYLCSMVLTPAGGAPLVAFIEGTDAACTLAVGAVLAGSGSLVPPVSVVATTPFAATQVTGDSLCIVVTGQSSPSVDVTLRYVVR